jgi:hypothetical protein
VVRHYGQACGNRETIRTMIAERTPGVRGVVPPDDMRLPGKVAVVTGAVSTRLAGEE